MIDLGLGLPIVPNSIDRAGKEGRKHFFHLKTFGSVENPLSNKDLHTGILLDCLLVAG
jgi:hypothetical protein